MCTVISHSSPAIVLALFSLMLLAVPAGVLQTVAFAQSSSSSLAQEIIDETATSVQDSSSDENVLEDNNEFGDDTQIAVPISDQDQTAENRAINLDIDFDEVTPTPPDDGELPPEEPPAFVAFCLVSTAIPNPLCFNTSEQCEIVEERIGGALVSDCEGVEELPSNALICVIQESGRIDCR